MNVAFVMKNPKGHINLIVDVRFPCVQNVVLTYFSIKIRNLVRFL